MKINKKVWKCYWCSRIIKKSWDTKRKVIMEQVIYICLKCWYNNSPTIFEEIITHKLIKWLTQTELEHEKDTYERTMDTIQSTTGKCDQNI